MMKITIEGPPGCGKTLMAGTIEKMLRDYGIEYDIQCEIFTNGDPSFDTITIEKRIKLGDLP